mgnify:CR=1 FL=1
MMVTKTETRRSAKSEDKSAFSWGNKDNGMLIGAALAGAAAGFVANYGRKFLIQSASGAAGEWDKALIAEHKATLALFDKMEATDNSAKGKRSILLHQLKFALSKHAIEEEMVIYPAMREAGLTADADELTTEHGYVKTYLYDLQELANDDPKWLATVKEFRAMIEDHMREEENDLFPRLKAQLSPEKNKELTAMMNKEGFMFA